MQDKLTTTYSVGYHQESETTILHFENSNNNVHVLIRKNSKRKINRVCRQRLANDQ